MGFKLGKATQPVARGGNVSKKLSFKTYDASVSGNPVIRKNLDEGILGEANMDGSIFISDEIPMNSQIERQVLLHEMRHATDMKLGKLAYNDDSVYYDGVTYPRETINGKDMIKVDGKWKEAGDDFPWERTANI
tara:strand:+ start:176 stop:577 length:402 start_codon:yes stop_codon:yes gene_type:complete